MPKHKTVEERQKISEDLKKKIADLGIPSSYEGVQEFHRLLDEYCKPNIFAGFSGKIAIKELSRNIEYILPISKTPQPVVKMTAA